MRLSTGARRAASPSSPARTGTRRISGSFASQHRQVVPYTQGELDGLAQTFWPDHCAQHMRRRGAGIRCSNSRRSTLCSIRGKTGSLTATALFLTTVTGRKLNWTAWLRGQGIVELTVLGLATDYCVKFTVLDALALGYTVNVIIDGCRGVNPQPQDSSRCVYGDGAAGATLYTLDDWRESQA